jgi:hypothetical protein
MILITCTQKQFLQDAQPSQDEVDEKLLALRHSLSKENLINNSPFDIKSIHHLNQTQDVISTTILVLHVNRLLCNRCIDRIASTNFHILSVR